jgi:hypothetical protein
MPKKALVPFSKSVNPHGWGNDKVLVMEPSFVMLDRKKIIFTKQAISKGEASLVSEFRKLSNSIIEAILYTAS